jgi:4-cresol dehydrogenase (hydroxylating)
MTPIAPLDLSYGQVPPAGPLGTVPCELLARAAEGTLPRQPLIPAAEFAKALEAWRSVLGAEHVQFDAATLERYSRCTLPWSTQPSAVLRPDGTQQVSELVKIAARFRIPLHPISRGKNWGYGDACAPTDGQVIVDLGRMNRILKVNEELAYAVIEPGVTQGQMYEHLRDHHPQLILDVTGAGPEASIVGNMLQRGFGHTPYGNHFAHTSGMEVVLPDGRVIQTGFGAHHPDAIARHIFPWGQGPYLDGLFTQSNLGIVTRAGIWLMPKPEAIEAFAMAMPREDQLPEVIDALRWLRLHDVVRSTVHVANDLRVISAQRSYPWELTGGKTPLPQDVRLQLRREAAVGAWNLMGGLFGTRQSVAAAKRVVRQRLGPIARVHFFHRRNLRIGSSVARLARRIGMPWALENRLRSAAAVYDLLCGIPSPDHLRGAGWRSRNDTTPAEVNAPQDGLAWVSPCVPLQGRVCAETADLLSRLFAKYRFDPLFTISAITDRAAILVASLHWNQSDSERERAGVCLKEAHEVLETRGIFVYRTYGPRGHR